MIQINSWHVLLKEQLGNKNCALLMYDDEVVSICLNVCIYVYSNKQLLLEWINSNLAERYFKYFVSNIGLYGSNIWSSFKCGQFSHHDITLNTHQLIIL